MLKDGQIFTELYQGDDDKHTFFKEIIRVQSVLGGINYEVLMRLYLKISAKIYHIMPFIFFANYKCSFVF